MPYDFKDVTSAKAYAEAEANGCTVKIPAPNELFIDIDDETGIQWFHFNIGKVDEQIGLDGSPEWGTSPSGQEHHSHVVIKLRREVQPMERIVIQAFLGSDLKREALSWVRLVNGDPNPTLFYEKKPLQLAGDVALETQASQG